MPVFIGVVLLWAAIRPRTNFDTSSSMSFRVKGIHLSEKSIASPRLLLSIIIYSLLWQMNYSLLNSVKYRWKLNFGHFRGCENVSRPATYFVQLWFCAFLCCRKQSFYSFWRIQSTKPGNNILKFYIDSNKKCVFTIIKSLKVILGNSVKYTSGNRIDSIQYKF